MYNKNITIIKIFIISLVYSLFLVYFFPIDDLIIDWGNYLIYAKDSNLIILGYINKGILSFFFNEPVWLLVNVVLSFFLVIAMYFLTLALQKLKFAFDVKFIVYFILGFVISFGLAFIASLLGMRQATVYEFIAADSSGLGFLFWLGILIIYISNGREFLRVL